MSDDTGYDIGILEGDFDMGARRGRGSMVRAPRLISRIPGAPAPASKDIPLGFGSRLHTALVQPSGGNLVARPQVPFRGRRLVVEVTRNAAAVAAGIGVNIDSLLVGSKNQLAASTAVPAATFGATATNVVMMLDSATPGIDLTLNFSFSAPLAGAEEVLVQAALIGDSIS